MPVIRLAGFAGENRALQPRLLPDAVGVASRNQKPGRGDLRSWKAPSTVASVPAGRQTIYRMGRDVASDSQYWLSWPTPVHVVRGFDTADTTERTYFTGDGAPKAIDNTFALASAPYPTSTRPLGLPAPTRALTTAVSTPSDTVLAEGREARTDVLVAPRTISSFALASALDPLTSQPVMYVVLTMAAGHGLFFGDVVNVSSSTHPQINATGVTLRYLAGSTDTTAKFAYQVNPVTIGALTPFSGTVTKDSDSVYYPAVAPVYSTSENLGLLESRFYTYTFVNDWGWESAPAPPSAQADAYSLSTVTLSNFATAPSGNYGINRIRIYRTQAGASGTADFYFLREVAYGTTSTTDDGRDLGETMSTTKWLPPPADLTCLTALWNGMLAGISGGAVRFCEAYVPYAWPVAYDVLPPDSKAVALGVFGQSLLVLTNGRPVLVEGSSPDSLDQRMLEIPQACVSARSAVSMGVGVAWASEDGLCWYGAGGAKILTAGLMTREDWQALNPSSIIGRHYEGLYFGSYDDGSGRKGFFLDPSNPSGIYFLDTGYSAAHFDELRDQLYVLDGTDIKKWDAGAAMTYRFRSKVFRSPRPINFSAAEVVAQAYPVTLRVFADGVLKHTQNVTSANSFRLPSGFLAWDWQIELEGTQPVQQAALATSMAELTEA